MNIILKTTLKNTFGKPFRSLLVIFSIFVCAFAALFCFDLAQTEKGLIGYLYSEMSGEADIMVSTYSADPSIISEDLPEYRVLNVRSFRNTIYMDIPGEYYLVSSDQMKIYGVDPVLATSMGYMDNENLGFGEIMVTDEYAGEFGVAEGDVIKVYDNAGNPVELTVTGIIKADLKNLLFRDYSGAVNEETADVLSCGKPVSGAFMIDIIDDSRIDEAEEILKAQYKSDNVQRFAMTEDMEDMMNELFGFLFILFAIAFLLVIFITFSICDRIVNERMSYIGTLRSLGMSPHGTAVILLLENVMYALLGSIPGVLLYLGIRGPMMDTLFVVSTSSVGTIELEIPSISKALVIGTVITAIAIECLIPLKSIFRALKISIRDIIFDNRDTEYKFSRSGIITGIVMAVIAVISLIFSRNLFAAAICLISSAMALAFLFPLILKFVTTQIHNLAEKLGKEKMALASREAISRKSTVSSGVLCATSAAMCILVYIFATSMSGLFNGDIYECDVVADVTGMPKDLSFVQYLDGVTDTEYIYQKMDYVYFADETIEKTGQFFGVPDGGYEMFKAIYDLPDVIEDGTIYVEKRWAENNGYSVGDTLTITFHPLGVFPIKMDFTIAGIFRLDAYEAIKNNFVISKNDMISIYHDTPGYLMVRCDDPDKTAEEIERYAVGSVSQARTRQKIIDDFVEETAQSDLIYDIVVFVALFMTCVGMISNQLIGFEGRKKECAVLISTSMSRKTLSGILFREMMITSLTAATAGTCLAALLLNVIKRAMESSETIYMPVSVDAAFILKMWVLLTVVFTLTVLFPIRNMRKMKLSEQLKYE
ncbi:MAG: ABC transporter permease [Lachnospiraceae bacterium]|nr:ABC transporter permease [Lachnospiraceae bacterium]